MKNKSLFEYMFLAAMSSSRSDNARNYGMRCFKFWRKRAAFQSVDVRAVDWQRLVATINNIILPS